VSQLTDGFSRRGHTTIQIAGPIRDGLQEAAVLKPFVISVVLLLSILLAEGKGNQPLSQAATPGPYTIPADALHRVNPVKPTPESIAQGKKYYGYDCAMCHGVNGDGNGDVARDEKLKLSDFRNPAALKDKTDGELFYIIKNGKGQMPPEGDRLKPTDLWNLVNYIRSLAQK
jgi:mono/diheme cytochrome c family protein